MKRDEFSEKRTDRINVANFNFNRALLLKRFSISTLLFLLAMTLGSLISIDAFAARDVVDVTVEASSDKGSESQARQDIFQQAIEQVSRQYIQQIIGESKYNKNEDTIKNKIIRESGKYVLFIKSEESKKSDDGIHMTVVMKLSLQSLQKLLLQQGLLYKISGPPKVLPLVQIQDRVNGSSFTWWSRQSSNASNFLMAQLGILQESLAKDLQPKGFYTLSPTRTGFEGAIPSIFRGENIPTEDELFIGEFFDSQIVVSGTILIKKSRSRAESFEIDVRLSARHTTNGRVVGEVIRSYQTEPGPMQRVVNDKTREVFPSISNDLTVQLHDAWTSGTFGSSLIRLVVNGDLSFQSLSSFKDQFLNQVVGVKTLRERKFMPGQVVFEIDSDSSSEQIAGSIAKVKFERFQVRVSESSTNEIELKVSLQ